MAKAIEAVEKGASAYSAAKIFNVPRTTLLDKISGRSAVDAKKGPDPVLTAQEETHLKNWLIFMADSGFPVTKNQLLDSVSILVQKLQRKNPFTGNRPGRHWYEGFIKRHPEIGQRVAQNLSQTRAAVKEDDIRTWFKEIEDYYVAAQLEDAAKDPRRVFNCDESAFFLSPTDNKVLAKRGSKNVYSVTPGGEKDCVTVLLTANAAGELAPPAVLFKYSNEVPSRISKLAPEGWGLGHNQKGWMTGEAFYEYMTNIFYPWVQKNKIDLPIIFFLDGHCSHTTLPLSNFCREHNITLISLYPNATQLLQPMDLAVFRPLKRIWKATVYKWRTENQFVKLKKENFCPLLKQALDQLNPSWIINGFRKSGLCPLNPDNVDYSKCVTRQKVLPDRQGEIDISESPVKKAEAHLKYFESHISPTKLQAFYEHEGSKWNGEKSLEGLFTVWNDMRKAKPKKNSEKIISTEDANIILSPNILIERNYTSENVIDNNDLQFSPPMDLDSYCSMTLNDIFDSNHQSDLIDLASTQNEGKVELFDVVNGAIRKISTEHEIEMDMEIPFFIDPPLLKTPRHVSAVVQDQTDTDTDFPVLTAEKPGAGVNIAQVSHNDRLPITSKIPSLIDPPTFEMKKKNISNVCTFRTIGHKPIFLKKDTSNRVTSTITSYTMSLNEAASKPTISPNTTNVTSVAATVSSVVTPNLPHQVNINKEDATPTKTSTKKASDTDNTTETYYGHLGNIPTPFKQATFWPEISCTDTKTQKKSKFLV
ncbi:DDE superfamily endonuclease domain-containing protein [Phthorimaea operculella]|nr:DDE superfamily endonuclease domain-containing protein [Phthorimaea operculella]